MRAYLTTIALSALTLVVADKGNFTINLDNVTPSTKAAWCQGQINTCGTLCVDTPKANNCTPSDLTFYCTCQNGSAPGLQYYTQTIDTFVCLEAFDECITAHVGDKRGQDACTSDIKNQCGTLDPTKFQGSSSSHSDSSSTSSSASGTGTPTSNPSGSAPTTSASKAGAAPTAVYLGNGAAVVAAGIFAALL
jgi:hypothetical protein